MRASERLVLAGAAVGLVLALWQSLGLPFPGGQDEVPPQTAVMVNEVAIPRAEYERAVEAIARDRENPLASEDRQRAVETLVNEELLVQQAEVIGLVRSDRMVRNTIVQGMIQVIVSQGSARPPDEQALRDFYQAHPEIGHVPERVRLRHAAVSGEDAQARARQLRDAIAGGARFDELFASPSAGIETRLAPEGLIPRHALGNHLPQSVVAIVDELEPGDIAGPIEVDGAWHFVWLQAREPSGRRDFAVMREVVAAQWRRRQEEQAVADYLSALRRDADIKVFIEPVVE